MEIHFPSFLWTSRNAVLFVVLICYWITKSCDMEQKLRTQMLLPGNKGWLKTIYVSSAQGVKKTIASGSVNQLRLLVKLCACVAQGFIPLLSHHFTAIKKKRKISLLERHFGSKIVSNRLLKSSRHDILEVLFQLSNCYGNILSR